MKPKTNPPAEYWLVFHRALGMMAAADGLEPTSAFKQSAVDAGIKEGAALGAFVTWARQQLEDMA